MGFFLDFVLSVGIISFWAAVLAFIPTALYLLVINPPIYKVDAARTLGIYIIAEEGRADRAEHTRVKVVGLIYAVCLVVMINVYWLNLRQTGAIGVSPFDALASFAIIIFWVSICSYLPFGLYLLWAHPWQFHEEGLCLTRIFIGYGVCILLFSSFYLHQWLKAKGVLVNSEDVFGSLGVVLVATAVLSYLPILAYVFYKAAPSRKEQKIRPSIIFVIFSISFIVFACIYSINWLADKKAGVKQLPLKEYFQIR